MERQPGKAAFRLEVRRFAKNSTGPLPLCLIYGVENSAQPRIMIQLFLKIRILKHEGRESPRLASRRSGRRPNGQIRTFSPVGLPSERASAPGPRVCMNTHFGFERRETICITKGFLPLLSSSLPPHIAWLASGHWAVATA